MSNPFPRQLYAINAAKYVTEDGDIVGVYTEWPLPGESRGTVKFFKIPTGQPNIPQIPWSINMTISGIYQGTSFTKSGLLRLAVNLDGSVYGNLTIEHNSCYSGTVKGLVRPDGFITLNYKNACQDDSVVFTGHYVRFLHGNAKIDGTFRDSWYPGHIWNWTAFE